MDIISNNAQKNVFENVLGINMPSSSEADQVREMIRQNGKKSLYYFSTAILKWDRVRQNPHLELCNFIQDIAPPAHKRRKVLLVPRDCYKSTIGSKSLPLWILVQDDWCGIPGLEHRILLCSFAAENARKQIKSIRQQIERNEILKWVYPEIIPDLSSTTWTDSNILFPRKGMYGEDTVEAAGVDTHIVSRHYTVQIKDDLEDKQAMESPAVRERVKTFYKSAEALFVDERQAYDLLIGTRWGVDDLYSEIQRNEYEHYEFMTRPLHWTREDLLRDYKDASESGQPPTFNMAPNVFAPDPNKTYFFFPELFPQESCDRLRAKQGSFMYSMLYLNNPKDPANAEFREKDLRYFIFDPEGNLLVEHQGEEKRVVPMDALKRVLFWDPAASDLDKKRNSRNAMVVSGMDGEGNLYIIDAFAERNNPAFLYDKFISLHQRWFVNRAGIEAVNFSRTLKFPLYQRMKQRNHHFAVEDLTPINAKEVRIRTLIPYSESHSLFIRRGLRDFVEEIRGFPVFGMRDLVDAGAACLELLGRPTGVGYQGTPKSYTTQQNTDALATRSNVTGY